MLSIQKQIKTFHPEGTFPMQASSDCGLHCCRARGDIGPCQSFLTLDSAIFHRGLSEWFRVTRRWRLPLGPERLCEERKLCFCVHWLQESAPFQSRHLKSTLTFYTLLPSSPSPIRSWRSTVNPSLLLSLPHRLTLKQVTDVVCPYSLQITWIKGSTPLPIPPSLSPFSPLYPSLALMQILPPSPRKPPPPHSLGGETVQGLQQQRGLCCGRLPGSKKDESSWWETIKL